VKEEKVARGMSKLTKAQLLALAKEQEAEIRSLKAEAEGGEGVWVVESTFDGRQNFPDASDPEKPDLVIPPFQKVVVDERWLKDPGLRRAIAAGRVRGPFQEKEIPVPPIPVEVPADLRLTMPLHEATVEQILTRPVKEMLPTINVAPRGIKGTTDVYYLKETMLPILRNALYRVNQGEGRPGQRGDLMRALKRRIKEIQAL